MDTKAGYTFYCRSANGVSALEVFLSEKDGSKGKAGRVSLRFGSSGKSLLFSMEPHEAHRLASLLEKAVNDAANNKCQKYKLPPHKSTNGGKESTATVTVESWARNNKSGVSVLYAKGDNMFNIGIGEDAQFMSSLLKDMAIKASWSTSNYIANETRESAPLPEDDYAQGGKSIDQKAGNNDKRLTEIKELLKKTKSDLNGFLKFFKTSSLETLQAQDYDRAISMLRKKAEQNKDPRVIAIENLMLKTLTKTEDLLTYFKASSLETMSSDDYDRALEILKRKAAL